MPSYQGRALESRPRPRPRRPSGIGRKVVSILVTLLVVVALAHVPWREARARAFALQAIDVEGTRYLDAARVAKIAGLAIGQDWFGIDCARARQALVLCPRIAGAEVERRFPRNVRIRVVEREPAMLVRHGTAWEIDSAGVLLAPLEPGAVSDVPLLAGPSFEQLPEGARVSAEPVRRGLQWVQALSVSELKLTGQVSEVDVSDPSSTGLWLLDGTHVLAQAWPPGTRQLSALRVVLADLKKRGTVAREVDLRFEGQVIVRPAHSGATAAAPDSARAAGA